MDPIRRDRERKVVEIVRHFLLTVQTFRQHQEKYRQGSLCFSDLARLVAEPSVGESLGVILLGAAVETSCLWSWREASVAVPALAADLVTSTGAVLLNTAASPPSKICFQGI